MIDVSGISKVQQAPVLKTGSYPKGAQLNNLPVSKGSSLYDNNGLSRAIGASHMSSVSFGSHIDSDDVSKLISAFKSLDPNIETFFNKLSNVFKSSNYKELNDVDKKIFSTTAFLNNYIKTKGIKPSELSKDVKSLIGEYVKDSRVESRINGLVQNSDLIEVLNKRKNPTEILNSRDIYDYAILKDFGIKFRKSGDINIAKLLMEKGLYGGYDSSVHAKSIGVLEDFINGIHQNGIWLPITKIPSALDIQKAATKIGSGDSVTENVVIDLANDNLEKLGFKKGVGKDNFSTIGHAVSSEKFDSGLQDYVTKEGTDSLLSASYFQDGNFPTFMNRPHGFFMDVDPGNIALADSGNMASGFAKDFIDFRNNLLTSWKTERTQFADNMRETLGISKNEYSEIYHQIAKARTIDEIGDPKLRTAIAEAIEKTVISTKGEMNEVVVYSPKSTALFSKSNIEDIPYILRKYAQDKNIPIIDISKF